MDHSHVTSASRVEAYLEELSGVVAGLPVAPIERALRLLLETWRRQGSIFVFGNGGSAATASHIACDFVNGTAQPGVPRLRCVALNDNLPLLTALANDVGFEQVFAEQLEALGRPGDLALAMSVSGTSPNIVAGVESAKRLGLSVILMTGEGEGSVRPLADVVIEVASTDFGCVETAHLGIEHVLTHVLRAAMGDEARRGG